MSVDHANIGESMSNAESSEFNRNISQQITTRILAGAALLGAISWMAVLIPDDWLKVPFWGIALIDLVAIPWIIAFLMFGLRGGLITSSIGTLAIFFFSEEPVPLAGAISKYLAITPLILTVYLILIKYPKFNNSAETLTRPRVYIAVFAPAVFVRCVVMVVVNLLIAIPLNMRYWTGIFISPSEVPAAFYDWLWKWPMENLFGRPAEFIDILQPGQLFVLFVVGIFLFNIWLSFIELIISYIVVYRSGLYQEFAIW